MLPLPVLLREAARAHGSKTAIITPERFITYAELDRRVDQLANAYIERGLTFGSRHAVMAIDLIEHIEAAFAIARAGGVYVPLNYRLRSEEVKYLLSDSDPVLFSFSAAYRDLAQMVQREVPSVKHLIALDGPADGDALLNHDELVASGRAEAPDVTIDLDDVLQIQYSSGTTGLPKGAVLLHRTLSSRSAIGLAESPRYVEDVYFNNAPFFHVAGSQLDYVVLIRGGTIVRIPQFEPNAAVRAMVDHGVTSAFFVPSMINAMLQLPDIEQHDFSRLRLIEYGAAPMPMSILRRAIAVFGCQFCNLFGAGTEGGLQSMLPPSEHRLDDSEQSNRRLSSIGRPAIFTEVRVVDVDGNDVKPGEVGEIISRGPTVMREYWGKPEATAETLRDGWLHAGDMATVDEDGFLYLVDRKKDMIIRGGENVYPAEIELALHEHPAILEAAVIGVPDEHWGENVKAIVVVRPGFELTEGDVIEFCRSRIASYKKPGSVDFVDALPRNASGKILKRELRIPFWEGAGRSI